MKQKKLNILHINKFHYIKGGAERYYFNTSRLLESNGHKSIFFSMHHPENLPCETSDYFLPYVDLSSSGNGIFGRVRAAGRIVYSMEAKRRLSKLLDRYTVDVAHLHNIHHQISPSILHELNRRKIPVVMTLHDYKMSCGSYSMISGGGQCEACRGRKYSQIAIKRCVKGSLIKSVLLTVEMYLHHKILDIYDNVGIFISPSVFLMNKLKEMGFNKEIVHLPYFVSLENFDKTGDNVNNSVVFFGRLSAEKGLFTLLNAAKNLKAQGDVFVNIIGDGPIKTQLEEKVNREHIDNVKFFGHMKGRKLYDEVRKNRAVVITSEWNENYPVSVLEAFALGKPVVGSRIGGIPELVKDGETGFTYEPGNSDDLSEKIKLLLSVNVSCVDMGYNASQFAVTKLNPTKHYQELMAIYELVMTNS